MWSSHLARKMGCRMAGSAPFFSQLVGVRLSYQDEMRMGSNPQDDYGCCVFMDDYGWLWMTIMLNIEIAVFLWMMMAVHLPQYSTYTTNGDLPSKMAAIIDITNDWLVFEYFLHLTCEHNAMNILEFFQQSALDMGLSSLEISPPSEPCFVSDNGLWMGFLKLFHVSKYV